MAYVKGGEMKQWCLEHPAMTCFLIWSLIITIPDCVAMIKGKQPTGLINIRLGDSK